MQRVLVWWSMVLLVIPLSVTAAEISGSVSFEYRHFFEEALDPQQHNNDLSVSIQPEFYHAWDDNQQSFTFTPFYRADLNDDERSHFDIRELSWLKAADAYELRVGVRKVFWGVTESQHLVDIINQTDLLENPDGEDKLGQPMLNLALINDWGTLDLFVLPYFRERTFPGVEGRLRSIPRVDTDNPLYQSPDKEKHIDYAARWFKTIDDWDIGISHFYGTSRDPAFIAGLDGGGNPVLRPVYNLIHQTGIDVQATKEAWLWKLEMIRRSGQGETYSAATFGLEYTLHGILESSSDLGVVVEYLYDDRRQNATTPFEDDMLLALRWTRNDVASTEALFGVIFDLGGDGLFYNLEATRRFSDNMKLTLEARVYSDIASSDPIYSLRNDDYIHAELAYYF